jgi:seipin
MLSLTLLSHTYKPIVVPTPTIHVHPLPTLSLYLTSIQESDIIHTVRRPALIPYTSRLISLSTRLAALPLYILGLRTETSTLDVELAENLVFSRRDTVPVYAMLEVQAGQTLQVYDAAMYITARFGGLRWWMYNHRILSAVVGISTFWACANIVTLFSWTVLRLLLPPQEASQSLTRSEHEVKNEPGTDEEPELSDTPRTFPTYGRQAPLRYEPVVKKEEEAEEVLLDTEIAPLGEADDEDEEEGAFGDSGLGTSYSEGGGVGGRKFGVRRRREKGG